MTATRRLWRVLDRLSIYLPVILMALMALTTYWLARNTPAVGLPSAERAPSHEPDYFMRDFSVKSFDPAGQIKSELYGKQAQHFPDTDTVEIDQPRIRTFNEGGGLTVASAQRAVSNGDNTEVQLIGDARVTRDPGPPAHGQAAPALEIRSEFLHMFESSERIKSHKPVTLRRGGDAFEADSLDYDNLDRVLQLQGRVRGVLQGRSSRARTP